MIEKLKTKGILGLKWLEKYTKTDMLYLVKNSFWLNANTIIVSLFSLILSIAFARLVEKNVYGTYQFIISLSAIVGAITLTGMNTAVTQAVARGFEKVFVDSVKIQIKYGFIATILGLGISLYYVINQNSVLSISMIIVALLLPISSALNTWGAFLSGKKNFEAYFKYSQIINLIYYSGMIATIIFIPNAIILVLTNFSLNAITNFIVYKLVNKKYKPNNNGEEEALSFGKKFSLSNILPMIALNVDNIVIFHYLGATNLAIYAFASNIPERLGGLLKPISTVAFPKLSEQKPEIIRENVYKKTFQFFILALFGGLVYIILSPFIFKIFFPLYLDSVFYSQLYTIAVIIGLTGGLPLISVYARRLNKIYVFNVVYPIISITLLALGGYFGGIIGIILAKITSNILLLSGSLYLNKF